MLLIDKLSPKPIYEQIIENIEQNILLGIYPPGMLLPSLRELSVTLGINPNTIQKAYAELTRRGVISPSPGSGSYVSPQSLDLLRAEKRKRLEDLRVLVRELTLAGIEKEELLSIVSSASADSKKESEEAPKPTIESLESI